MIMSCRLPLLPTEPLNAFGIYFVLTTEPKQPNRQQPSNLIEAASQLPPPAQQFSPPPQPLS